MKINNLFKLNLFWLLGTTVWGMDSQFPALNVVEDSLPRNLKKEIDQKVVKYLELPLGDDKVLTKSFNLHDPHVKNRVIGFKNLKALLDNNKNLSQNIFRYLAEKGISYSFIKDDFLTHENGQIEERLDYLNIAHKKGSYAAGYALSYFYYLFCNNRQDWKEGTQYGLFDPLYRPIYEKKFIEIEKTLKKDDPLWFHFCLAKNHISLNKSFNTFRLGFGSCFFHKLSTEGFDVNAVLEKEIFPWETVILSTALAWLDPEDQGKGYVRLAFKLKTYLEDILQSDIGEKSYWSYRQFVQTGFESLIQYFLSHTNQNHEALSLRQKVSRLMSPKLYGHDSFYQKVSKIRSEVRILLETGQVTEAQKIKDQSRKDYSKALSGEVKIKTNDQHFIELLLSMNEIEVSLKLNPQEIPKAWKSLKEYYKEYSSEKSFQESAECQKMKNYLKGFGDWSGLQVLTLEEKFTQVHSCLDSEIEAFKPSYKSNGEIPLRLQRNFHLEKVYFLKAQAYQAEEKTQEAIALLQQLDQNPKALRQLCEIYERQGDLDKALEHAQKAYRLSKSKPNFGSLKKIEERVKEKKFLEKISKIPMEIYDPETLIIPMKEKEPLLQVVTVQDSIQDRSQDYLASLAKIEAKEIPEDFDPYPFWADAQEATKERYIASLVNVAFLVSKLEGKIPSRSEGSTLNKWGNRLWEDYNSLNKQQRKDLHKKHEKYTNACDTLLGQEPKSDQTQEDFIPDFEDTARYPILLDSFSHQEQDVIGKILDGETLTNKEFESFLTPYLTKDGKHQKASFYLVKQKDGTFKSYRSEKLGEEDKKKAILLSYNYAPYHHPKGPGDPVYSYKINQFKDYILTSMGLA